MSPREKETLWWRYRDIYPPTWSADNPKCVDCTLKRRTRKQCEVCRSGQDDYHEPTKRRSEGDF